MWLGNEKWLGIHQVAGNEKCFTEREISKNITNFNTLQTLHKTFLK